MKKYAQFLDIPSLYTKVILYLCRCEVPEANNKIFISFAKAFKKPDGAGPVRSPQTMHEVITDMSLVSKHTSDNKNDYIETIMLK